MQFQPANSLHYKPTGVYLSLKGIRYSNRSVIFTTEIGETDVSSSPPQNNGLQCITDRMPCCRFEGGQVGEWFFPDGTIVPAGPRTGLTFYRNRGSLRDDGTVNLNRDNINVTSPTGLFCCTIPDATGTSQTLCANIGRLAFINLNVSQCYNWHSAICVLLHSCSSDH